MDAVSNQCLKKALEEMHPSDLSDVMQNQTVFVAAFETLWQSIHHLSEMLNSARQTRSKN